jgi:hypothetical protein
MKGVWSWQIENLRGKMERRLLVQARIRSGLKKSGEV